MMTRIIIAYVTISATELTQYRRNVGNDHGASSIIR